jgi:4-hydroxy-tetrahydrodipicolinate synthase
MTRRERLPVLRGAMTAIVTPFRADGEIDLAAFEKLVNWQIDSGIHGLVPCGTTGEGATLRPEEHALVIATTVRVAKGRVPTTPERRSPAPSGQPQPARTACSS